MSDEDMKEMAEQLANVIFNKKRVGKGVRIKVATFQLHAIQALLNRDGNSLAVDPVYLAGYLAAYIMLSERGDEDESICASACSVAQVHIENVVRVNNLQSTLDAFDEKFLAELAGKPITEH